MPSLAVIYNFVLLGLFARRYDDWAVGAFAAILAIVGGLGTIFVIVVIGIVIYKRRQKRIRAFHAFAAQNQFNAVVRFLALRPDLTV